jgi:hypothetical protein
MLNIIRDAEFWIAKQADTMEMATTVSSARPSVESSRLVIT